MITIIMRGRFGNQLFFYALAKSLTHKGHEVKIILNGYEKPLECDIFKFNIDKNLFCFESNKAKFQHIFTQDTTFGNFDPRVFKLDDGTLIKDGYFQSDKYFKDYIDELRNELILKEPMPECYKNMLTKIKKDKNATFIHVRRGDYLLRHIIVHYPILGEIYYKNAIDIVLKRSVKSLHIFNKPKFYIFSDDIEWIKSDFVQSLGVKNYEIMDFGEEQRGYFDFCLMRECRHAIIANSTFSWWAALLIKNNKRLVISPSEFHDFYVNNDMWPNDFLILNYKTGEEITDKEKFYEENLAIERERERERERAA